MNNEYRTQDIYLSAFLVATGIPLESFQRDNGRTTFRFHNNRELGSLVNNFYADKAQVSALRYGNSLRNLKAMIYSKDTDTYDNTMFNNRGAQN